MVDIIQKALRAIAAKKAVYQDRPRYPKVVDKYEQEWKDNFRSQLDEMTLDLTKKMREFTP